MCGIVVARHDWIARRHPDPGTAMRAAVAGLAWRGPDGQGVARAGVWWLGCARLAISEPRSRQPVVRRGGRFVGVLNGAITGAGELWARLRPRIAARAARPNDAWLPLLAVAAGDGASLRALRGHHAYAVADAATGTLVFGQDRFGEKPLWCLVDRVDGAPALVALASTPAALHALGAPPGLAPRRLAEWFRRGWAELRPFRHTARFRREPVPRRGVPLVAAPAGPGWCREFAPDSAVSSPVATARAPDDLRRRVVEAAGRCADTSVPAGLSLSGGIDSSCLALALRAAGHTLPAFQLHVEGEPQHERRAAVAAARSAGLPLRPIDVGPEVLDALPWLTTCAGLPLGDPSVLAVHAVARAAAADGVRVLLSGEGADELFLGYRRYRALALLPRRLPRRWLGPLLPRWSMRYPARWLRALAAADPAQALLAVTPPAFAATVLAPELAARGCWRDAPLPSAVTSGDRVLAARAADLDGYLRCDLLPKVDVATMAAGVEARCPFLEGDLEAYGATRRALGKAPLRAAFCDLPTEVLHLPKHGFALPLDRWFRSELPWLDLLAEPRTRQRPHLRAGGVAAVVDRHRRGRADLGHALYLLVALELHLRAVEAGIPTSVRAAAGGAT